MALTALNMKKIVINGDEPGKSGVNGVEPEMIGRLTGKIAAFSRKNSGVSGVELEK